MLISKFTIVKWNGRNKNRYVNLGYVFTKLGDSFEVNVCDLTNSSTAIVEVKCDYCGEIMSKKYEDYFNSNKSVVKKDACLKCSPLKMQEVTMLRYGKRFSTQIDSAIEKRKNTNLVKYGFEHATQSEEVKSKSKQTCLLKYGVENPMMLPKYKEMFWGENGPRWKHGIKSVRSERSTHEYREWRKNVYQRDSYTCQCCAKRGGFLHAHHIEGWANNKDLRYDINNGMTLCKDCHNQFHSQYGKQGNTLVQIDEFLYHGKKIC